MVKIELKGVTKVTSKGKDYYYAWRGGPPLRGLPGSPEFLTSYQEAQDGRRQPDGSRIKGLVAAYKASGDYTRLAASTRRQWSPWLDRITEHFGELRVAHFDRPEKIKPHIRRWRDKWRDKPRAADYGMQVLSRVLAYGVDPLGKLATNPCEGIKPLYKTDRSAIIWTEADLAQLKPSCSPEVYQVVEVAAHTGLRLSDVLRLSWNHVKEHEIVITTGKSRHRIEAHIPMYQGLRMLLKGIRKRSTSVLTNTSGAPWTTDGFGSSFNKAKRNAKLADRDLHFNDLRGTAATKFYKAGLDKRVIAEIMAWEEESVDKIIRRYVDRNAATIATIRMIEEAERRTENAKPPAKP